MCRARVIPRVGRRADEHDLSRLCAAVEALAPEVETQKTLDNARGDLPNAQYHRGLPTTPQLSTQGRLAKGCGPALMKNGGGDRTLAQRVL